MNGKPDEKGRVYIRQDTNTSEYNRYLVDMEPCEQIVFEAEKPWPGRKHKKKNKQWNR